VSWVRQHALALGLEGLLAFVVGLALGAAIVYGLHAQNWGGDPQPRRPAAFSEVPEPRAGELGARFRPWLRFDARELWRPLNVSLLFQERIRGAPAHEFCPTAAASGCTPVGSDAEFRQQTERSATLGGAAHLDLAGNSLRDYRGPRRCDGLADCGTGPASAIYYHVMQSNDRYYVDYWWFLRFNNFYRSEPKKSCANDSARAQGLCDEHEGDWEGVTVVTPPGVEDEIDYVVYAAHKGTFRYSAKQFGRHGTRPDVFVARGSHASYPQACQTHCLQPIAAQGLFTLPEASFDGTVGWERNADTCEANAPGSCLLALPRTDADPQAWTVWPGLWGANCPDVCRGKPGPPKSARSPGLQARYQTPWCSTQADAFTCDGLALGCRDWLGPLVAVVACDPDALSKGLRNPKGKHVGTIILTVRGEPKTGETTPGVVQAPGDPLAPGDSVTVSGGGPGLQILVRARQGDSVAEVRFADLRLASGEKAVVSVTKGESGPIVQLPGHRPIEKRELEVLQTQ
jgi:hypothetical protein